LVLRSPRRGVAHHRDELHHRAFADFLAVDGHILDDFEVVPIVRQIQRVAIGARFQPREVLEVRRDHIRRSGAEVVLGFRFEALGLPRSARLSMYAADNTQQLEEHWTMQRASDELVVAAKASEGANPDQAVEQYRQALASRSRRKRFLRGAGSFPAMSRTIVTSLFSID
jgi:hypothetical protein